MQFRVCPLEEFSSSSEPALCMKCEWEDVGERSITVPISVEPQREWEFLGVMWFNTSVSLAAVPAFHDSAFHHLKHVIAFDDNRRILWQENRLQFPVNMGRQHLRSSQLQQMRYWNMRVFRPSGGTTWSGCFMALF